MDYLRATLDETAFWYGPRGYTRSHAERPSAADA